MLGLDFPHDFRGGTSIRDKWVADMTNFCKTFYPPNGKFETEQLLILRVNENRALQGYIDLLRHNDDGMQLAHLCQESHLKTCIYTGCTQKEFVDLIPEHNFSANMALFDYIKVGPYIKERGGLACKTTNQVFYKKVSASPHNTQYAPANYLFQKEYK